MPDGKMQMGTVLAVIATAVAALTLYYARRDKSIENRPILDISDAKLVQRTVGEFELDEALIKVVNHGNRIASKPEIHSVFDVIGNREQINQDLAEMPPGQTILKIVTNSFDVHKRKGRSIRFNVVMRYTDRVDDSQSYVETVCFDAPLRVGFADDDKGEATNMTDHKVDPPIELVRCPIFGNGWDK